MKLRRISEMEELKILLKGKVFAEKNVEENKMLCR